MIVCSLQDSLAMPNTPETSKNRRCSEVLDDHSSTMKAPHC